jgi:hypothetical protein
MKLQDTIKAGVLGAFQDMDIKMAARKKLWDKTRKNYKTDEEFNEAFESAWATATNMNHKEMGNLVTNVLKGTIDKDGKPANPK